jgi:hypothetical protein
LSSSSLTLRTLKLTGAEVKLECLSLTDLPEYHVTL